MLDDWGLTPLREQDRRDLLAVMEDRDGTRSTLVASQISVEAWHDYLGDAAIADGLLHSVHEERSKDLHAERAQDPRQGLNIASASLRSDRHKLPSPRSRVHRALTQHERGATKWR